MGTPRRSATPPAGKPRMITLRSATTGAAAARVLVRTVTSRLPMRVRWPDGTVRGAGGAGSPELRLVRPDAFHARLGSRGLRGFGESYLAGDWETDDLSGLLTVLAAAPLQRLHRLAGPGGPNGGAHPANHEDLSYGVVRTFLDPTLTCSSALFADDPARLLDAPVDLGDETLADAQRHKIARVLDMAGVGAGTRLLEIGTGWGELALEAADRGADVTTITLSQDHATLTRCRILDAGLGDNVRVLLQDYRDTRGLYDAVVSVETIEAVGGGRWGEYVAALSNLLVPGGRVGLQAVTTTRDAGTWGLAHLPGGNLPSKEVVAERAAAVGLDLETERSLGLHYAETLRRWRARFEARADEVGRLGFDEVFRRRWSFSLACSEAGFRSGDLDVVQYGFVKPTA